MVGHHPLEVTILVRIQAPQHESAQYRGRPEHTAGGIAFLLRRFFVIIEQMVSVKQNTTIKDYQNFVGKVYGLPNDRYFSLWDMITNMERFMMRGLKGIRKKDAIKTKNNLLISFSWFMSIMNQLHIDIEEEVWKRFPYKCSYCVSYPCFAPEIK